MSSISSRLTVSVIIPVFNRGALIGPVIEALMRQSLPPSEIIVVDDGSVDNTGEVARSYPVKYIRQENRGPASARNRGFRESTGDVVAFIDSDCIARPDWLERLVSGFDSPEVGAVAGSYDIANPDRLLSRLIHEEILWRHSRFGRYVRAFGSYNVAIRRDVFELTGGFDESYRTASGEDNDLSYRILKAGYKIRFVRDSLVAHYHTDNLLKYLREQFRHAFWRMKLYRAHPEMVKGDDYTTLRDGLEIPLTVFSLACLPLLFTGYWYVEVLPLLLFFLLRLPFAMDITLKRKDPAYLLLLPLSFVRAIARFLGMIRGIRSFWFARIQNSIIDKG